MIIRELCLENFTKIPQALQAGVERRQFARTFGNDVCDTLALSQRLAQCITGPFAPEQLRCSSDFHFTASWFQRRGERNEGRAARSTARGTLSDATCKPEYFAS